MYKSALLLVALMAPGIVLSQTAPPPEAQANPTVTPAPGKRNPFSSKAIPAAPTPGPVAAPALPPPPVSLPSPAALAAGPAMRPPTDDGIKLGTQDDGRVFVGIVGDQVLYRTKDDSYVLQPHRAQ